MPAYIFENPKTGETVEVFQKMMDKHEYFDDDGLQWNRVFVSPNASIDSAVSADTSEAEWMRRTGNKKMTVGDAWDASKELSDKREKQMGKDPVKEKFFKDYSKKRKGMKHEQQKKSSKHWDTQ
tara:strand:- start:551 stop:922 length:372 start_codon:yes stop_codon:yes gene_type:complete